MRVDIATLFGLSGWSCKPDSLTRSVKALRWSMMVLRLLPATDYHIK